MSAPLDDIEFLARSENRVRVLDVLQSAARDRREVHEVTDIPRTTVGRILSDFQERGWVRHDGRQYEITTFGACLATEFGSLVDATEAMYDLGPILEWLPIEEFDFGLEHFADAEITLVERDDVIAPVRKAIEVFEDADRLRLLAPGFVPEIIEARWRATVHGTQTSEAVLSADVIDAIAANTKTARWYEDIARSDRAALYRYDGPVPYAIATIDDRAAFMRFSAPGTPQAMIETDDEAVRSWVERTIDAYQDDASLVDSDAFTS